MRTTALSEIRKRRGNFLCILHLCPCIPWYVYVIQCWDACSCLCDGRHVHRRSQDFVWGCTFSCQKCWPFFSRRPQRPSKYTSKSNPPSKNCPINWLLLWLGCTSCPGGALTHFPVNYAWKKIFSPLLGCRCTHCTPGYAYGHVQLVVGR